MLVCAKYIILGSEMTIYYLLETFQLDYTRKTTFFSIQKNGQRALENQGHINVCIFPSLLDNAHFYLVECVNQKRYLVRKWNFIIYKYVSLGENLYKYQFADTENFWTRFYMTTKVVAEDSKKKPFCC